MEDFSKDEVRKVPRTELKRQQNYMELLPRPSEEEYQLLKESIERDGLQRGHPILINDDDVVLDGYTRLQIAEELNEEWVYVHTLEFEDHYAEKLFIIESNLVRRHLLTGERAAAALKFKEIEKEKARERQRQAGELYGKSHPKQGQESGNDSNGSKLPPNSGEAMELLASKFKIGQDTLYRAQKIEQAAQTDPKVAEGWDKIQKGEATVNQVYQQVHEKAGAKKKEKKAKKEPAWKSWAPEKPVIEESYLHRMMRDVPVPPPAPDPAIMEVIYGLAGDHGISREEMDAVIAWEKTIDANGESFIVERFRLWTQNLFDVDIAWDMCEDMVKRCRQIQRSLRPEEVPVPDESKKLGPRALDFVHKAGLKDLVRDFPSESAHMIYSDAVADLEQVGLLGELAARVLTPGKYLCVYVDKRQLPEAMARLSAAGLTYFWTCMVFRPDAKEVQELQIKEIWRLMLIYQKGETVSSPWDWFYDSVKSLHPTSRDQLRQLLKGLTLKGQMVVDPMVGSGITGQVARSMGRRFLCFGANDEDVRAANQRIAEVRLVEENGSST